MAYRRSPWGSSDCILSGAGRFSETGPRTGQTSAVRDASPHLSREIPNDRPRPLAEAPRFSGTGMKGAGRPARLMSIMPRPEAPAAWHCDSGRSRPLLMLAKLASYTLVGIDAMPVEVEVDVSPANMPKTVL